MMSGFGNMQCVVKFTERLPFSSLFIANTVLVELSSMSINNTNIC